MVKSLTRLSLICTALTYAGEEHDYGNCKAAMRNIDPDCNLHTIYNFTNTKCYLENDINDVIKRNNLNEGVLSHAFMC